MPAAVESMFSHREVPWHGLGKIVDQAPTSAEAISLAGLDWEVEKRKTYTLNGAGNKVLIPGAYAMVRTTDDLVLGTVKERYEPFQNSEAFAFTDTLVDDGEAVYETAGSLKNGRLIFLTMKMPESILVGGEDRHDLYILLRTSHDGTKAIGVYLTPIRVVCTNTLALATKGNKQRWSMPHVGSLQGKIAEAREMLKLTFTYADEFAQLGERLMSTKITDDNATEILYKVLPRLPRTDDVVNGMMDAYHNSTTNAYTGTGWGLVNALTEYQEHLRDRIQPEGTFQNVIGGQTDKYRNQVSQLLLAS